MRAFAVAAASAATGAFLKASQSPAEAATASEPVFDPNQFKPFEFISSYDESHNSKVLRFALPAGDDRCNFPCASCVVVKFTDADGKAVIRPYTPISRVDQTGYFELLVKKYKGAKMGTYLHNLKKGDTLEVKGPIVKIPVKSNQYRHIGMICGGTGIAPMYQVARTILATPKNQTEVSMIYANSRKEDVLLGNELNNLMMDHPLFSPYFVLSKPPSNWMGGIGHVNQEMIKSFMPGPERVGDSVVMVCGPPGFMAAVSGDKDFKTYPPTQGELSGMLKDLGYPAKMVFKF